MKIAILLLILLSIAVPAYGAVYTYDELNRLIEVEYDEDYKIKYYYDNAGNISRIESTGDKEAPEVSVDIAGIAGEDGWYRSDVTVTITATDEESGVKVIEYVLNDESSVEYSEPLIFTQDSKNTLKITATDNYDNKSEELIQEINIDRVSPDIIIPIPDMPEYGTEYIISPIVEDEMSGVASTTVTVNEKPVNLGDRLSLELGETVIRVVAKDFAGNTAEQTATITVRDEIPPTTAVSLDSRDWSNEDVAVTAEYNDEGGSGLAMALYAWAMDEAEPNQWEVNTGKELIQTADGSWYLYLKALDIAGNETIEKYGPYNIDKTAPVINAEPISQDWINSDVIVTPEITDQTAGLATKEYAWTSSEDEPEQWLPYSTGSIAKKDNGIWYLHLKAIDKAGNTTTAFFGPYNIDKVAPTVTVSLENRDWDKAGVVVIPEYLDEGGSGIRETLYAWTQEESVPTAWQSYNSNGLTQEEEGVWYLYLKATDYAGNEFIGKYGTYNIDKTAPVIVADPADRDWTNSDIDVITTVSDLFSGVASVEYGWSESNSQPGQWNPYGGGILSVRDTGIWYLHLKAMDNVGNVDIKCFGPYKIDKVAPTVAAQPENRDWLNEDAVVLPEYDDQGGSDLAQRQYSWSTIAGSPGSWLDLSGNEIRQGIDGEWYLFLKAVDTAGNEVISEYGLYQVDKTLPEINYSYAGEYYYGDSLILQYQASDTLSGIQETYVNYNGVRYENGTEVIIDKAGMNIIEMVAVDVAGNIRAEVAEIEVIARANVDIDPDVINLKNIDKGNAMITAYITLPSGLSVSDILLETISINGVAPVTDPKYGYVKNPVVDHEGQVVFMAKFERAALGAILSEGDNPVILTGRTGSYTFTWSGVIHAMNPGNDKKDKPENGKAKGKNKGQDIEEENEQQIDEEQEEDQEEQIDEEQNKQESQEDQIEEHDDTADSVSDIEPEEPGTQTEEDVNLEDIKE